MIQSSVASLAMIAMLSGCIRDTPVPLTSESVDRALTSPTHDALRERIAALNNPLIHAGDFDPERPLTPGGAAVLAVVANPAVRAQRSRLGVVDAQLLQAGILPNPTVSFGLDVPVGSNTAGEAIGYGLSLEWEVTALISRGAKVKSADLAARQVRLDVVWSEWQIAQAARLATYAVIGLREQRADATKVHDQLARVADKIDLSLATHDVTLADAAAVRAAEQDANVTLGTIARDLRDAELALNQAVGVSPSTPLTLADSVSLPTSIVIADADAFSANLENRRVDLVALRRGYESQTSAVRAAILGQFPRIALGISNTRDFGDFLTLGPAISADLPFFDRNQGNIAIARATRQQLLDEYIARVFEARSDIARAVALIRSLNELIAAQTRQVDSLRSFVTAEEAALSKGNINASTYYTAAVGLSQKQSDLFKLKWDLIRAMISLELASGAHLSDAGSPTTVQSERTP